MTLTGLLILSSGFFLVTIATVQAVTPRLRGMFYGWWLVAISGFVMILASVPVFFAMSVWAVALERHFGWNRTQLGFALTFTRVEGGIMGPLEGYLTDRVGTRRMVLFGLIVLGVAFLFFGQVRNLWMFYLAYVLMSMGEGLGSWVPLLTMLNHWFIRQRASAMAWASVISRAGAILLVPLIAWAIDPDHDRLGWSLTATVIGVFVLLVALPLSRLIRNQPQDYNLLPDGGPPTESPSMAPNESRTASLRDQVGSSPDLTTSQALRTSAFWLISFGHGLASMVILAIFSHLGLMMEDKGFAVQTTAWIVTVYLAFAMVFQVVGGYLGDRFPKRVVIFFIHITASWWSGRAYRGLEPVHFLPICSVIRHGVWRAQPADNGNQRRLLWPSLLRKNPGPVNGPYECTVAHCIALRWVYAGRAGNLYQRLLGAGWFVLLGGSPFPICQKARTPPRAVDICRGAARRLRAFNITAEIAEPSAVNFVLSGSLFPPSQQIRTQRSRRFGSPAVPSAGNPLHPRIPASLPTCPARPAPR